MEEHIIINIGRQFGSGGKSVAEALGRKLGLQVYDNELILKAAEKSGISPEVFSRSDESKHFFKLGSIFSSNRFGSYTQSGINDGALFKIQSDAIREIAASGSAIFVGRVSDYVLRDMRCLDVFITAPLEERITRVSSRMNLTRDEAEKLIRRKDKERKSYYDFFSFGDNWGQAANYDLCIDSGIRGIEGTADFIIEFGELLQKSLDFVHSVD